MTPHKELLELLLPAYAPCSNFGRCREAVWRPQDGHMPRGFLGATGDLTDVSLVMVFAEPGHSYGSESYDPEASALNLLMQGVAHTHSCFASGHDLFHRNARWFLDQVFPDKSFDEQLRHVWMTEGRLCSVAREIGGVKDRTCAQSYLFRQLDLMPDATIVAFGGKAQNCLKGYHGAWLSAYALSPPGANHRPARPSWEAAIQMAISRQLQQHT